MIYYKTAKKHYEKNLLWVPSDLKFRHIRGKDFKGRWVSCKKRISTAEKLKKWVLDKKIINLYLSSVSWLNPTVIKELKVREGYEVADRVVLRHRFIIDLDAETFNAKGFEKCRKETEEIVNSGEMEKEDLKLEYILITGHKGYQISYEDLKTLPEDARERIPFLLKRKVKILEKLKQYKTIDFEATKNLLGIFRYPGSIHKTTGSTAKIINTNCLGSLKKAMTIPRRKYKVNARTKLRASPTLKFETRTLNKIVGTKDRYILSLSYSEKKLAKKDYTKLRKDLKGTTIIGQCKENKRTYLICLTAFTKEQLMKIIKKSEASNKTEYYKYGKLHTPWPIKTRTVHKNNKNTSKAHNKLYNTGKGTVGTKEIKYKKTIIKKGVEE